MIYPPQEQPKVSLQQRHWLTVSLFLGWGLGEDCLLQKLASTPVHLYQLQPWQIQEWQKQESWVFLSFWIPKSGACLSFYFLFPSVLLSQQSKHQNQSEFHINIQLLAVHIPTPWSLKMNIVTFSARICLNLFRILRNTSLKNKGATKNIAMYLTHACHAFLSPYIWQ